MRALGLMMMLLGAPLAYLRANVVSEPGFVARMEQVRQDPEVRALLATRLVRELEAGAHPDLIAARPLTERAVSGALRTAALAPVFAVAFRELHRDLFQRQESRVRLDLSDAGIVLIGLLRVEHPRLAERIPIAFEQGVIDLGERPALADRLAPIAARVSALGLALPLAALAAFALAVALARDRWRAVRHLALGIVGVGLVLLWGVWVAGEVLGEQARGEDADAALRALALAGLWRGLAAWAGSLVVAGIAVAAAAAAVARSFDVPAFVRRTAGWLASSPEAPRAQLVHGLALIALGVAAVLWPLWTLRALAMVVGCLLTVWGLGEAIRWSRPPAAAASGAGYRLVPAAIATVAALALFGLAVPRVLGPTAPAPPRPSAGPCNGHEALCDRTIAEVTFPATHNAMSAASRPGWMFAAHDGDIRAQLDHGVRGLLIDMWYGAPRPGGLVKTDLSPVYTDLEQVVAAAGPEAVAAAERLVGRLSLSPLAEREVYLCHVLCELGATPAVAQLAEIRAWLERNPREVLILFIEDAVAPQSVARAFEESGLIDHVYDGPMGARMPTLRALIDRGQQVVLSESGAPGVPWYRDGFALVQDNPWNTPSLAALSCAPGRGRPDSPLLLLNHWIARQPPSVRDARVANSYEVLLHHARRCENERGMRPNLIAVDFYQEGDLIEVVEVLNGVAEPR